jgi:hypothetical protein
VVLAKKLRRFCCRCNDDDEEGDDEEGEEGANREEAFIFMRHFDFIYLHFEKNQILFSRGVAFF